MADKPLLCSPAGRQELYQFCRQGLLEDTLPFWFPRCVDREHGGFVHFFDRDGTLFDTDKSVWAQGRISWMLLKLYDTVEAREEWITWAESGLRFLQEHCSDTDGRMFFHVTRDGRPIRRRRYAYSEAFAAIAYAAHAKVTGNAESAERSARLFRQFVDLNFVPGRLPSKYTDERPLIGLAPRMITLVTAQELRECLGSDDELTAWIDRCIGEIRDLFVKPELRVVMESVTPDGGISDHADGRMLNPGHAMEGAWFIMNEGRIRGDSQLMKLGCQMLDFMWDRGWDKEHGGICCLCDVYGRPVQEYWHDMKFWWPHNEAVIASMLAYVITGEERYAVVHQQVHDWSQARFADSQFGEWYGYLHRDGRISASTKGNLWKSFFHHPRMQWMCSSLLRPDIVSGEPGTH